MKRGGDTERASAWKSGLILALLAAVCTTLVAYTYRITAGRIDDNERAYLQERLRPAVADMFFDNDLSESTLVIEPPHQLPGQDPVTVYRLYNERQPVAALFVVTAPDGYSGPIRLLIGVGAGGRISGVHVLQHRETPGLGDRIEASKSDWVEQFPGASLGEPPRAEWGIRRDGGAFDQLTGASITPRAVVKAIRETLIYFEDHRDAIFAQPPADESGTAQQEQAEQ